MSKSAGKTIPIYRGGGVNQKHLLDFAKQAVHGGWLHIFPEGGVYQNPELGGRVGKSRSEIGSLKWGVAKLIAHCPVRPIVIPYFHQGMEKVIPMEPVTRKIPSPIPKLGETVHVVFGKELSFEDLISAHQKEFGKLWTYRNSIDENTEYWNSRPSDYILYHKIMTRIELALSELNEESMAQ